MKPKGQKRAEAIVRQAAHDKLSIEEKLDKTTARPGRSERERNRLVWALTKGEGRRIP